MTNILLIIADQHRGDYVGFRDEQPVRTPYIDALARRGIAWDRAMSPAPLCGPARASLFTGKHPHQVVGELLPDPLGVRTEEEAATGIPRDMMINDSIITDSPEFTQHLKDAGYHTAYAGKWHLGNDILPAWFDVHSGENNRQYTDWLEQSNLPMEGWPLKDLELRTFREPHMSIPRAKVNPLEPKDTNDPWITNLALNMIRNRPEGKPFFQVVGFNGPHPPFKIAEPYFSMYAPQDFPAPSNFHPSPGEPESKAGSFYRQLWKDHGKTWDAWQPTAAAYAGFCTQIDAQLGRLVEHLELDDLLENTLIIYTSDHGEMLGQHGLWHKMQPYEMSLRIPLVMAGPGVEAVGRVPQVASLADIPSTILKAAGLEGHKFGTGRDLRDKESTAPDYWFSEQEPLGRFHGEVDWRLVTDGPWKFIWNRGDSPELYDLESDPDEMKNMAGSLESRDIEGRLKDALLRWMAETQDKLAFEATQELAD